MDLRGDRRVVEKALAQDASALGYASEKLRADGHLVLVAVAHSFSAFEFAHNALKSSKVFVRRVVTLG